MLNQDPQQPAMPPQPPTPPIPAAPVQPLSTSQPESPAPAQPTTPLGQPVQNSGHDQSLHDMPKISGLETDSKPWVMIFAVIAVFIALIGNFMIYFLKVSATSQIKSIDSQLEAVNKQLQAPEIQEADKLARTLKTSLAAYQAAITDKIDYSRFNEAFAAVTPKNVTVSNLTVDGAGAVKFSATAPDFLSAGKTYLAYKQASLFQNVTLDSIGLATKENASVTTAFSATLNSQQLLGPKVTDQSTTAP